LYADVVVAVRDINPGEKIDETMLNEMRMDIRYVNLDAVKNKTQILGKYALDKIIGGEQVVRKRISMEGNEQLSFAIPKGKRAVTIAVNEVIATGYMIKPGNKVDVIVSFEGNKEKYNEIEVEFPKITKHILQNVQDLAIGTARYKEETTDGNPVTTYTLAVTPDEAEKLIYGEEFGRIRLALRPIEDHDILNSKGVYRKDITPGY